ncbi:MAG: hypothetical protein GOV02_03415 [Candidatus Aenigmarchaeota archaeon]|nr:hypothetical protein [Candidatus Aenigmarchaeota archaeon]
MLLKIFGILFIILGLAFLRFFPDIGKYQPSGFTNAGLFIGVLFIVVGISLIIIG